MIPRIDAMKSLPVRWIDSDGVEHSISLEYAALIARYLFEVHGNDIDAVDEELGRLTTPSH